ncbi:TPA: Fic family protein [Clostridioides difficile]|nr:Fic family protein [Clostridioides difficile]
MKDIYLYDDAPVLKNKFGIKDSETLEKFEAAMTHPRFVTADGIMKNERIDFEYLKKLHKHLFDDIYSWAGEPRQINIEKPEKVLNGLSVEYCDYKSVEKEATLALKELKNIKWSELDLSERAELFSKGISKLWKVHAFREGNSRTIMTFAVQFAERNGFYLDKEIFRTYSDYVRDSLVLASIGEYSEHKHLITVIKDSMEIGERKFLRSNTYVKFNSSFNEINKNDVYDFGHAEELIMALSEKYNVNEQIKLSVFLDKGCKKELISGCIDLKNCKEKLSYIIKKDKRLVKLEELER